MDISKLDATKRQLYTAINLYFKNADPVSIHTLTAAAHQILMDLSKLERIKSIIKDPIFIKQEYKKEYLKMINEAENYFKHAEKDPRVLLKFNPEQSEFLLLDAIEMYMQLTKEMPEDMTIYHVYFRLKYPELITDETKKQLKEKNINIEYFKSKSRLEFYSAMKNTLIHSKFYTSL